MTGASGAGYSPVPGCCSGVVGARLGGASSVEQKASAASSANPMTSARTKRYCCLICCHRLGITQCASFHPPLSNGTSPERSKERQYVKPPCPDLIAFLTVSGFDPRRRSLVFRDSARMSSAPRLRPVASMPGHRSLYLGGIVNGQAEKPSASDL